MEQHLWVELIKILAWPFVVMALFLLLYSDIRKAISKISRIRYRGLVAELWQKAAPQDFTPELESGLAEDAAARERSPLDIKVVEEIVERALDQIGEEFGKKVDGFIYFFNRHDLSFVGAVLSDDILYVMDIVILRDSEEIPEDKLAAVSARTSDLRSATRQRNFNTDIVLIVVIVTDLTGNKYLRLESKLRERFSFRSQEEVRIIQSYLLRAKVNESDGSGSKG